MSSVFRPLVGSLVVPLLIGMLLGCSSSSDSQNSRGTFPSFASSDQALLTPSNALDFAAYFYLALSPTYAIASIVDMDEALNHPDRFMLFEYEVPEYDDYFEEGDDCETGSIRFDDRVSRITGLGLLNVHFADCAVGDEKISGRVSYEIRSRDTGILVEFHNLVFQNSFDQVFYNGSITYFSWKKFEIEKFYVRSEALNKSIYLADVALNDFSLNGSLWVDELKWVDFQYDGIKRELQFSGAQSSYLLGTHERTDAFFYSTGFTVPYYTQMEFLLDPGSIENPRTRSLNMRMEDLFTHLYLKPSAPTVSVPARHEGIRSKTLKIDFDVTMTDRTFVDIDLIVDSFPNGCPEPEISILNSSYNFLGQCVGVYQISIEANNGYSSSQRQQSSITLHPQLAQIAGFDAIEFDTVSGVRFPIRATNELEDGPFEFAIQYSPSGYNIDDGYVVGSPDFRLPGSQEVHRVGIRQVDSEALSFEYQFSVDIPQVNPGFLPFGGACDYPNRLWGHIDTQEHLQIACPLFGGFYIAALKDGEVSIQHSGLPLVDQQLVAIDQIDLTQDGYDEILLKYKSTLFILDGITKETIRSVPLVTDEYDLSSSVIRVGSVGWRGIYLGPESSSGSTLYFYNFKSDSIVKEQYSEYVFLGDFWYLGPDQIPFDFSGSNRVTNLLSGKVLDIEGTLHLGDITGDEFNSLIAIRHEWRNEQNHVMVYSVDAQTGEETIVGQVFPPKDSFIGRGSPSYVGHMSNSSFHSVAFFSEGKAYEYRFNGENFILISEYELSAECTRASIISVADRFDQYIRVEGQHSRHVCHYDANEGGFITFDQERLATNFQRSHQEKGFYFDGFQTLLNRVIADEAGLADDNSKRISFFQLDYSAGAFEKLIDQRVDRLGDLVPVFSVSGGVRYWLEFGSWDNPNVKLIDATNGSVTDFSYGPDAFFLSNNLTSWVDDRFLYLVLGRTVQIRSLNDFSLVDQVDGLIDVDLERFAIPVLRRNFFPIDIDDGIVKKFYGFSRPDHRDFVFSTYSLSEGGVALNSQLQIPYAIPGLQFGFSGPIYFSSYLLRDSDNDGNKELVVHHGSCLDGKSVISVYNPSGVLIKQYGLSQCIDGFIDYHPPEPSTSLYGYVNWFNYDPDSINSRLIEIESVSGAVLRESTLAPGVIMAPLFVPLDLPEGDKLGLITAAGVFLFEP